MLHPTNNSTLFHNHSRQQRHSINYVRSTLNGLANPFHANNSDLKRSIWPVRWWRLYKCAVLSVHIHRRMNNDSYRTCWCKFGCMDDPHIHRCLRTNWTVCDWLWIPDCRCIRSQSWDRYICGRTAYRPNARIHWYCTMLRHCNHLIRNRIHRYTAGIPVRRLQLLRMIRLIIICFCSNWIQLASNQRKLCIHLPHR